MTLDEIHDQTMLHALDGVRFGSATSRNRFYLQMLDTGVRTANQRFWLTKLVAMYRRQVRSDFAVATAQAWLDAHPELDTYSKPRKKEVPVPAAKPEPPRNLDLFGQWT